MRSEPCAAPLPSCVHPAPPGLAVECRDAALRVTAYLGALALIALGIFHAAAPLTDLALGSVSGAAIAAWSEADCRQVARAGTGRTACPPNRLMSVAADWTTAGSTLSLRGGLSMN